MNKSHSIFYCNVRRLLQKVDELKFRIESVNPIIVGITESWLNCDVSDAEGSIPGYSLFRSDRIGGSGGGVALFMRDEVKVRVLSKSSIDRVESL